MVPSTQNKVQRINSPGNNNKSLQCLPHKPLSIVLSFLSECDGTSLLITNKHFASNVLPKFELPASKLLTVSSKCRRHKFVPWPVEDPDVLLARLNTKRLSQRIRYYYHQPNIRYCYRRKMTTEQLAEYEHSLLGLICENCYRSLSVNEEFMNEELNNSIDDIICNKLLPAHLELLRFRRTVCLPDEKSCRCSNHVSGLTLLASYPRSGNSLLRSLLERVTGVVTGSDTRPDRTLSLELADVHNMVGEGLTCSQKVWVVKTHFPERRGWKVVRPNRILLLTRNPFDAIDSYFHMALTNTHTKTLADSVYEQYSIMFDEMAKSEIQTWKQFHEYWFSRVVVDVKSTGNNTGSNTNNAPLLAVRYEDLLTCPIESMRRVISFMIGTPLCHPTDQLSQFWEDRLHHVLEGPVVIGNTPTNGQSGNIIPVHNLGSYKPRSGGGIGKSISRYSKTTLLKDMHTMSGSMLSSFGYNVLTQDFPKSLSIPKRERVLINTNSCADERNILPEIIINVGKELRAPDNPYGRNITAWRKGETKGDSIPLPTI